MEFRINPYQPTAYQFYQKFLTNYIRTSTLDTRSYHKLYSTQHEIREFMSTPKALFRELDKEQTKCK
jgi:hypothetical protein